MKNTIRKLIVLSGLLSTFQSDLNAQQNPISCVNGIQPTAFGCAGSCIFIQNQSGTPQGLDSCFQYYYWSMPGGSPSTYSYYQVPCVTYTTPGTYTVTLWGAGLPIDPNTSSDSVQCIVTVYGAPDASFTGPSSLCINEAYNGGLNNVSSNSYSIFWDMGDGSTFTYSNNPIINYAYSQPGTYWVTACVTDSCGSACDSQLVTVLSPQPRFTTVGSCQEICFYPDTTCIDQVLSHLWTFGVNNATSTAEQPCYTYPLTGGPFTVTHTITTSAGTYSYTDIVTPPGPPQPIISGLQVNNCGSGYYNYQIQPCLPGYTYIWSVSAGSTIINNNGCNADISWSSNGGYVSIIMVDNSNPDCKGYDTLRIPPCCFSSSNFVYITNDTVSKMMQNQNFAQNFTPNGFFDSGIIIINGILVVDTNFTFYNSDIAMGANAIVEVQAGQTFTIDSSIIGGKCGYMWDGIHVSDPTAMVKIVRHSTVTQAKRAVYSTNGGNYLIDNSRMQTNVRCVVVEQYSGTHQGRITRSTFNMQGTFFTAFPALPLGYTKTVCAIEIENNSQITIGDASQPALRNRFNNVLVGIRSKNSRTTVVNAEFTNFNPSNVQAFVPDAGTGIVSIGGKSTNNYLASLTVGGTGNAPCLFDNMKTAINISQRSNNYIYNNTIRKVSIYGIRVFNADAYGIDISGNTITNSGNLAFNTGIYLAECYNATVNINNNTINQTAVQPLQNGVGISVSLAAPSSMTMNIFNNTIARVRTGIWLYQLTGPSNVFVKGNTIKFFKPNQFYQSAVHYGLRLEGCITVSVDSNRVTKNGNAPNAQMLQQLRGISVENSPGSLVINNYFEKCGSGLFAIDFCFGTTIACDTFTRCYNGVFFATNVNTGQGCYMSDQVNTPGGPAETGCEWNNSVQFLVGDITGNINSSNPIIWRHGSYIPQISVLNLSLSPVANNACGTYYLMPPQMERTNRVAPNISASVDTNTRSDVQFNLRNLAHNGLTKNPNLIALNLPDDSLYVNFYSSTCSSNIGRIRRMEMAIDSGNCVAVNDSCNSMQCSNSNEHFIKEVYAIYSLALSTNGFALNALDSAALTSIATMDPTVAGSAVYSARAMLNWDADYFSGISQRTGTIDQNQNILEDSAATISVYPNPASDVLFIDYLTSADNSSKNVVVEILEVGGRVVLRESIKSQSGKSQISTNALSQGLYIVQVSEEGSLKFRERIVIVR